MSVFFRKKEEDLFRSETKEEVSKERKLRGKNGNKKNEKMKNNIIFLH